MQRITTAVMMAVGMALSACADRADEASTDDTAAASAALIGPTTVRVTLARQSGVSGVQRVNFAIPLPRAALTSADLTRVVGTDGVELPAARRVLASYP